MGKSEEMEDIAPRASSAWWRSVYFIPEVVGNDCRQIENGVQRKMGTGKPAGKWLWAWWLLHLASHAMTHFSFSLCMFFFFCLPRDHTGDVPLPYSSSMAQASKSNHCFFGHGKPGSGWEKICVYENCLVICIFYWLSEEWISGNKTETNYLEKAEGKGRVEK